MNHLLLLIIFAFYGSMIFVETFIKDDRSSLPNFSRYLPAAPNHADEVIAAEKAIAAIDPDLLKNIPITKPSRTTDLLKERLKKVLISKPIDADNVD